MTQITLSEYVELHGQAETARRAGLSQGAIWQMLRAERRVFVTETGDGTVTMEEVKPIKRNTAA
jgi:predicted DNA-binding protein (UPF0251 family)